MKTQVFRVFLSILFLLILTDLAVLHTLKFIKLDSIAITLVVIGLIPVMLPYANRKLLPYFASNFKSVQAFGVKVDMLENKIEKQEDKLKEQQMIIHELVVYSLAFYLYEMLKDFHKCEKSEIKEYIYRKSPATEHSLRYLRDNGYMEMTFRIGTLNDGENIASKVKLTPIGRFYISIREEYNQRH